MADQKLLDMTLDYAVRIVEVMGNPKSHYSLFDQGMRAGTSIGANVHEASYGASKADFTNKMQIALKECRETEYWLTVMQRARVLPEDTVKPLLSECKRIRYLLSKSVRTSKGLDND